MAKSNDKYLGRCFNLKSAYGTFRKISLGPDDLKKMNEFAATNKGWANILIKSKKTENPGETDFYCELDTWVSGDSKKFESPF